MNDKMISLLRNKQDRLSRRYKEIEDAQGRFPNIYSIFQRELQRIDDINECYRRAIYSLELAAELERKGV